MKHIHDRKIIHRDLKAQNIFVMKSDNSIRLGDFGVARILDYTAAKAKTQVGTPYYIAPEILKARSYTNKADIWSLGILLYEISALDVPIKATNLHDLYQRIMTFKKVPALPRQYSSTLKNLIESMLNTDASKRPSINDLLDHKSIKPRISKLMNDEELKEEFDHTVLHKESVLDSGSKAQVSSRPSSAASSHSKRPYSARSGMPSRGGAEEAKRPVGRPGGVSRQYGVGGDKRIPKPGDRSGDKEASNKFSSKNKPSPRNSDRKISPGQIPKQGMGARKYSAGMINAQRNKPILGGAKQPSPRNKPANFHYNKAIPNPSQTPRISSAAKKLNMAAPVGFQKERPSSAAYAKPKASGRGYQKQPFAHNNGRAFR